jgi:hypothetical protein
MAQEKINVTIDERGNIEVKGEGFEGSGCEKIIDDLCNQLGQSVKSEKTADYYKKAAVKKTVQTRG